MLDLLMSVLFGIVIIVGLVVINAFFWSWFYTVPTSEDEVCFCETIDGWKLAVHHYYPVGEPKGNPCVLCHGLGSNRYNFDLPKAPSLATYLKDNGRDVWVAELRGSGMSAKPGILFSDVPYSWGFEEHLKLDLPAILDLVSRKTCVKSIHWIGHSMGGMLIQAYISGVDDSRIASVTAIGSPSSFSVTGMGGIRLISRLRSLIKLFPFNPLPFTGRLATPMADKFHRYLLGLFSPANISRYTASRLISLATELTTSKKLWLDFGRFVHTKSYSDPCGKPYLSNIDGLKTPMLILAGQADLMAPPESVMNVFQESEANDVRTVLLGKSSGCREDYGHMDMVVGQRVETEVFPIILDWITRKDVPQDTLV
jgi:pimeloyl-ACP methyl ester carboxylesterase